MEIKEDKRIYTLSKEAPAKAVVKMGVSLILLTTVIGKMKN